MQANTASINIGVIPITLLTFVAFVVLVIWLLYRAACAFDDVRYLAERAEKGDAAQRRSSPLRFFVIVAGLFLALSWAMAAFNINPFAVIRVDHAVLTNKGPHDAGPWQCCDAGMR